MGLFKPAWLNKNEKKALAAVERIKNHKKLYKIFKDERTKYIVGEAALNKITDESFLANIAINDGNGYFTAIQNINDQSLLLEIIDKNGSSASSEAVKKIIDQNTLADIAKTHSYWVTRREAIAKLDDQSILTYIVQNDKDPAVRFAAFERLKLPAKSLLEYIVKNESNVSLQEAALKLLDDQQIISYIAKNNRNSSVRKIAVEKLTDVSVLAYVAKNDDDVYVRFDSARKVQEMTSDNEEWSVMEQIKNESEKEIDRINSDWYYDTYVKGQNLS